MSGLLKSILNTWIRKIPSWLVYVLGAGPGVWVLYLALTNQLGLDPVKSLEHSLGETGLQFLLAGLAVTPVRQRLGVNFIKHRRAFGVTAFFYVLLHFAVWLFLDVQVFDQIIEDILKRPYITVGIAAFTLMIPLAVTSNNWSVRKLGPKWRKLHKLTYGTCLLGALHFVLLAKGFQVEPLVYLGLAVGLLLLRIKPKALGARAFWSTRSG